MRFYLVLERRGHQEGKAAQEKALRGACLLSRAAGISRVPAGLGAEGVMGCVGVVGRDTGKILCPW